MEQQNGGIAQNDILRRILFALKKNWLLILIIIAIFIGAGAVYTKIRKPVYTASQDTIYKALSPDGPTEGDANVTYQYLSTVADFCDEGCVVDRANFYWAKFTELKSAGTVDTVAEFNALVDAATSTSDDLYYTVSKGQAVTNKGIVSDKISVSSSKNGDTNVSFKMTLHYTDPSQEDAGNKVKILLTAINKEAVLLQDNPQTNHDYKYFYVKVILEDFGDAGIVADVSLRKILIIFALVGVAVSLIVVYLINLFNRTVRDKDELERLTGTNVLAFIEDQGEGK